MWKWYSDVSLLSSRYSREDSQVAQWVKNPPAVQEKQVQSPCREDPLEEGMAAHFSILVWRIPWTEEPGGLSPWGQKESDTTEVT